eukprot:1131787-Rhodomonas_salina.1
MDGDRMPEREEHRGEEERRGREQEAARRREEEERRERAREQRVLIVGCNEKTKAQLFVNVCNRTLSTVNQLLSETDAASKPW